MNPKFSQTSGSGKSIVPQNYATFRCQVKKKLELLQYTQLERDLNGKLKAQAKLNFAKCLSHLSCLLISSTSSFSFICLLFSLQLTVLQVNVLSYPLFHSNFFRLFPCSIITLRSLPP